MNIVFMGTPDFAVPALKALEGDDGYRVRAVFTRADAVSRRGMTPVPSPVRVAAEELGLCSLVHTPRDFYIRDEQGTYLFSQFGTRVVNAQLLAIIEQAAPDVIVVAAYGVMLPSAILDIPRYGCVNIHASLLPRWRGAAPIQRALLAGDTHLGVSIMRMEEGLDTGPYCATAAIGAGEKNAIELTAELAELGAQLLIDTLPAIAEGTASWVEQDETKVTYADKIGKQEMVLDATDSTIANLLRVRASTPAAPARSVIAERPVTVLAARISTAMPASQSSHKTEPSATKHLFFACSDGELEILELKPDGRRAMTAAAFLAGL